MPMTVPIPALDRASYISLGPEVPPVILHRMRPHLESLPPTIIVGTQFLLAAATYSGSPMSVSTMSPSVRGDLSSISLVR